MGVGKESWGIRVAELGDEGGGVEGDKGGGVGG